MQIYTTFTTHEVLRNIEDRTRIFFGCRDRRRESAAIDWTRNIRGLNIAIFHERNRISEENYVGQATLSSRRAL